MNNQQDMSENSITDFEDNEQNKPEEQQEEEEAEEIEKEENNEKKPKEKIPYQRKNKHSFRSRVKHLLKRMNKDDVEIEQFMDEMDEIAVKDLEDKEAIEYGWLTNDEMDEHPSLEEEIEGERAREKRLEEKMNPQPLYDDDNEEVDDDDQFSGLPPSTSQQYHATFEGEDGVLYD